MNNEWAFGLYLNCFSRIFFEVLRKTIKTLSQNWRCRGRDLNLSVPDKISRANLLNVGTWTLTGENMVQKSITTMKTTIFRVFVRRWHVNETIWKNVLVICFLSIIYILLFLFFKCFKSSYDSLRTQVRLIVKL